MNSKEVKMPVLIAIIAVVVVALGIFGYRQMAPPSYATTKETGVPDWVKNWKPDQKTAAGQKTGAAPGRAGSNPAQNGQ